ncbi:methyltransferase domain-containing protein [Actinomadura soli]|uniref:Methyltransferase domain-containing protein n=1 Tax=Actinomadura soli TaxID=2508997 RepID=A0A5C4JFM9_9ACTN|nr:class I SAM-dependent methyltransferase [Actinomadura soli]TMR03423.1 methyltransferase domain-containing protein [Actinomadura soli]
MGEDVTPTEAYYDEAWRVKLNRPEYATLNRRWRSRWDFVAAHIRERADVLDMGCGDGVLGARLIRDKGCDVFGVDVSDYALDKARSQGIKASKSDISMSPLPFDGASFDAVVLSCVLEHIPHPEHALAQAVRVLRAGGSLFVTLPNPLTWKIRLAFLRGEFHPDFLHSKPGEGLHYRFWRCGGELEAMVADLDLPADLKVKEVDVKNPKLYSRPGLRARRLAIRLRPGLFGEYMHYFFLLKTR